MTAYVVTMGSFFLRRIGVMKPCRRMVFIIKRQVL